MLGWLSPAVASDTVATQIKTTITAACSLSLPAIIDSGEIPCTAFQGKSAGEQLTGYGQNFTINIVCHSANNYALTFTPDRVIDNFLTANTQSGDIGFYLYNDDRKVGWPV